MKRAFIITILFLTLALWLPSQDVHGTPTRFQDSSIVERTSMQDSSVQNSKPSISYGGTIIKRKYDLWNEFYPEFGITLGPPSLLNLNLSYWFGPVGVSLSGMAWSQEPGIQANFGLKLYDTKTIRHSISVLFGHFRMKERAGSGFMSLPLEAYGDCFGFSYQLYASGFFLEVGSIRFNNGRLQGERSVTAQIGYMYRFLP